ncbi:glycosyltransferase [Cloacibacillus sp. An23]|uniref:glycosyltransferase family 8 protein n=1 Tax=Cloacibacillus sp. An23 TaxID=1965591 RepID=UPI0013028168|nr:glycosyltransferase [Cloacibacillus sp. An23]
MALTIYDPDGTYARHAGVVIASVLQNTSAHVFFHVLHDETLTECNKIKLEETCAANSPSARADIRFIDISNHFNRCLTPDIDDACLRFTRGSLYRLCMHEMLTDIRKVLYLDCDVVVTLDISELWHEFAEDDEHSVCGVCWEKVHSLPDITIPKSDIKTDSRGLNYERYINSGVLVVNLDNMRSKYGKDLTMAKNAIAYIKRYSPKTPDQDFINAEFIGDILYVDRKYNFAPDRVYDDLFSLRRIWHFYLKGKPWQMVTVSNADMLYWHYLLFTPWKEEIVESFYKAAVNDRYYHRHSCDCIRRLWRQFTDNIRNIKKITK